MTRLLRFALPAVVAGLGFVPGSVLAGGRGCACSSGFGCAPAVTAPYWCDTFADLSPWPDNNPLYEGVRNWAWRYPHGGFTAYPGLPGSGVTASSDYSHINWLIPPQTSAQMVLQKLESLNVPLVPQETMYLGKNPGHVKKTTLPIPGKWIKEAEKAKEKEKERQLEMEREKDAKEKQKDKDKDKDKDDGL